MASHYVAGSRKTRWCSTFRCCCRCCASTPKYEAFAAEVGAEKFFSRGTKLESVADAVEGLKAGSGTMRIPAIVPELLEKREQDRKRLVEVERQTRDLEHSKTQLVESQRMLREEYARIQQEAKDRDAASAATIRDLQAKVRELESLQQRLADAESQARGVAADSQAELARVSLLESRMVELQAGRARAQAAATDSERVLSMLPLPTWICDMETLQVQSVSDSAAALFDITPEKLRGRGAPRTSGAVSSSRPTRSQRARRPTGGRTATKFVSSCAGNRFRLVAVRAGSWSAAMSRRSACSARRANANRCSPARPSGPRARSRSPTRRTS